MWDLLKKTFSRWLSGNVFEHSAALAYGTLFAIAPTLVLAIGISGIVFGEEAAEGQIFFQIRRLIGAEGAATLQRLIRQSSLGGKDVWATFIGVLLFIFGSTAVFAQLKGSLNHMWCVKPDPITSDVAYFFKTRLLSLAMVVAFCFVLLVSLLFSAALAAFGTFVSAYFQIPPVLLGLFNFILSTGTIAVVFAMIFKVLPDVGLHWKDVWLGAGVTALLFAFGKQLIALYLGKSTISSIYGAAGSLVVLMIWVYYSSLILFFGVAFTQAYTAKKKRKIRPTEHAVWCRSEIYDESKAEK